MNEPQQVDIIAETMREDGMTPESCNIHDHLNMICRCIQKLDKKIQDMDKAQDELSDSVMDDITPLFSKLSPFVNQKQTVQKAKPKKKICEMILTSMQRQIFDLYRRGFKQKEIA